MFPFNRLRSKRGDSVIEDNKNIKDNEDYIEDNVLENPGSDEEKSVPDAEISAQETSSFSEENEESTAEVSEITEENEAQEDLGENIGSDGTEQDGYADESEDIVQPLSGFKTGLFYTFCYSLGLYTFRYGRRFFLRVGRTAIKPLLFLKSLARVLVLAADRIFFKTFHAVTREARYLVYEVRSVSNNLREAIRKNWLSVFPILWHYSKKALYKYKYMFKSTGNVMLPVIALVILWFAFGYWNSATYSLKLTYEGKDIGNIRDESVYIKAQSLANEKFGITEIEDVASYAEKEDGTSSSQAGITTPKFEIELVTLDKLSDEQALYDKLIENSSQELTNACGVFVDNEFLGAVKNETDAVAVFDSLLEPYQTGEPATIAAFVEDVRFVQGLYPSGANMLDAKQLKDKISGKKAEALYHSVVAGETVYSIAKAHGLTESALLAMNPGTTQLIKVGQVLLVSAEVNFVRVKLMKPEVRIEEIPFEVIKNNNPRIFRGDKRITRKGVPGKVSIKEQVTYIDGVRISAREIDRTVLSEPIPQKVDIGTKPTTVSSSMGSYRVSISKEGFVWPVPGCYTVSSPYGYRRSGFHDGVDIACSGVRGKPIVAAKDGVVSRVSTGGSGLGHYVEIDHGGGVKTGYGHCLAGSISVRPGQRVSAGQPIARVGSTGNSTGPHLHFNLIVNGKRINGLPYIR